MEDGMIEESARWALPMLFAGQAQKEMFYNEALVRIDMLLHARANSADLATPPEAPEMGDCWIVAAGATGAWEGRDGQVAGWTDGGWRFILPQAGLQFSIADRDHALVHDGAVWAAAPLREDGVYLSGIKVLGARQPAIPAPSGGGVVDAEARTTLDQLLTTLRLHGLIEA